MKATETIVEYVDVLKRRWQELSERERRLLSILGTVFLALAVFIPVALVLQRSIEIGEENEAIKKVLNDIENAREVLEKRVAQQRAAERRYALKPPDLSAFLEEEGRKTGLSLSRTQPQPDTEVGSFNRRSVRADIPDVALRPAIELMAAIDNSRYPVALDQIVIDHSQLGSDRFGIKLGLVAFERRQTRNAKGSIGSNTAED